MFTGPVGPFEIVFYWPKAVFFFFFVCLFLRLASDLLLVSSPEGSLSGCGCFFRPEVSTRWSSRGTLLAKTMPFTAVVLIVRVLFFSDLKSALGGAAGEHCWLRLCPLPQ